MSELTEYPTLELEISDVATLATQEMVERLYSNNSVVTGNLVRSIRVQPEKDANGVITYPISLKQYGIYVDDGAERRAGGMPPVQAIADWIRLKRINVPAAMTPQQFAWAVAKSIAKRGQRFKKPKPFIDVSLQAAMNQNIQKIADAAAYDIANNIETNYGTLPTK
jgi:hypothetical protein